MVWLDGCSRQTPYQEENTFPCNNEDRNSKTMQVFLSPTFAHLTKTDTFRSAIVVCQYIGIIELH